MFRGGLVKSIYDVRFRLNADMSYDDFAALIHEVLDKAGDRLIESVEVSR